MPLAAMPLPCSGCNLPAAAARTAIPHAPDAAAVKLPAEPPRPPAIALPLAPANITAQEVLVYSGANDKATQDRVIAYLANRNRIALT